MFGTLEEKLPEIMSAARAEAEHARAGAHRLALRTREQVMPGSPAAPEHWSWLIRRPQWSNRLIYGDPLLVMAGLLAGDTQTQSLRKKLDLACIQVQPGPRAARTGEFPASVIAACLAGLAPRLILLQELLARDGSLYVHLDSCLSYGVGRLLEEIFGSDRFRREVIWTFAGAADGGRSGREASLYYGASADLAYPAGLREPHRRNRVPARLAGHGDDDSASIRPDFELIAHEKTRYSQRELRQEDLMRRVIRAACRPRGIVAEFFDASGFVAAAADSSGHPWIAVTSKDPACLPVRKCLLAVNAGPFLIQSLEDGRLAVAKNRFGSASRDQAIAGVLAWYGASSLPIEHDPHRRFGTVVRNGGKTLVLVDFPDRITGMALLRHAIAQRDYLPGGWDKVLVLGWQFEPDISGDIAALEDPSLDVRRIPPRLLRARGAAGEVESCMPEDLASPRRVLLRTVQRHRHDDREELVVRLRDYAAIFPHAGPARARLELDAAPFGAIDYWAVDPDYDGKVFRVAWQACRDGACRPSLPIATEARFETPHKAGERHVCVRTLDLLGLQAEAMQIVPE